MIGDILDLKNKFKISKIDQNTLAPFIYIAIILIGIDMLTTVAGLRLGLEENNFIALILMNNFGDFYGLMISIIGKCIIVIFPMIAYQHVEKKFDVFFFKNTYKNTYWVSYMVFIITIIMTTLIVDINNIMVIIGQLQYQDYIRSLSEVG